MFASLESQFPLNTPDRHTTTGLRPPSGRLRQRKWRSRVFTGCGNCRRRHVKCDEGTPTCGNCSRLALSCDYKPHNSGPGCPEKFSFKAIYTPEERRQHELLKKHRRRQASPDPRTVPTGGSDGCRTIVTSSSHTVDSPLTDDGSYSSVSTASRSHYIAPVDLDDLVCDPPDLSSPTYNLASSSAELYYSHFLTTVSRFLIIYDTPSNSNPYRMLPRLTDDRGLLRDAMVSLGALHLANLPITDPTAAIAHHRTAVDTYSSVVGRLRTNLADNTFSCELGSMATILLLCLFEKMRSVDSTWKFHLNGARQVFEIMYSPRCLVSADQPQAVGATDDANRNRQNPVASHRESGADPAIAFPMRRFLISLMAYLDVAAACATDEGTLVDGDYWETYGGGWEYNLGAPSFRPTAPTRADRELARIRSSWSRLMSIQAGISAFARMQNGSQGGRKLDAQQAGMLREGLEHRIAGWHDAAPELCVRVSELDSIPEDASETEVELLTGAACVYCYALACTIYLDRVATRKLGRAAESEEIAASAKRILMLCGNFADGLNRMAILWSVFTAGTAVVDDGDKAQVRQTLSALKVFGFQHVTRGLDILEYTWLQRTLFGAADYDAFQKLASDVLLP
ncbi:hypothetical protein VTK73DRAFT_3707 [Phialemonium thermophilum]|uniref:Zn(2)-C6 fungal-type domain-containing protein n=1 Tax=Phialemonium thermophilum TaxID=223376 RepID=A0ABR3WXJ8_9PEZI